MTSPRESGVIDIIEKRILSAPTCEPEMSLTIKRLYPEYQPEPKGLHLPAKRGRQAQTWRVAERYFRTYRDGKVRVSLPRLTCLQPEGRHD